MSPVCVAAQQQNVKWFNSESGDLHFLSVICDALAGRQGGRVNLGVEIGAGQDFMPEESPPYKISKYLSNYQFLLLIDGIFKRKRTFPFN